MNSKQIKTTLALSARPEEAEYFFGELSRRLSAKQLQKILPLLGQSRFLAQFCLRHPELVGPAFKKIRPKKLHSFEQLTLYKYSAYLRITLLDLQGAAQELILQELSELAVFIIRQAHDLVLTELAPEWSKPLKFEHHIAALGKLGGMELNYSSDVDLLAMTRDESAHEFVVKLSQGLTSRLQAHTEEGFLYRVDWDLRPEGRAGTLVNSLSALESYYENFGMEWERQMLTKFSPLLGSKTLASDLMQRLEPFIYRKHHDLNILDNLLQMREKLHEQWVKKQKNGFHVKLDTGGIREIEFFAQVFLLLYGGNYPKIRHAGTLPALAALAGEHFIPRQTAVKLREAYLFLRKLEHRLQMVDEEQTHFLKTDQTTQLEVARLMGFLQDSAREAIFLFEKQLSQHRQFVHATFEGLFQKILPASRPQVTRFKRLNTPSSQEQQDHLRQSWAGSHDYETVLDETRRFKKQVLDQIKQNENRVFSRRRDILAQLAQLAETICGESMALVTGMMREKYGDPMFGEPESDHPKGHAFLSCIAMGKLGGQELGYQSDLDLIFIYSEEGQTSGPKKIYNSEYFARVAQKLISFLSVPTREGQLYEIDTELRPSGNYGALVTSLQSFLEYQKNKAQIWERQSLLKARPIAGSIHLCRVLQAHLDALVFRPVDSDLARAEMSRLRHRVELELAREDKNTIDYKKGAGAIMDIEFILQFIQLSKMFDLPALHTTNTFIGLDKLAELNILPHAEQTLVLKEAYDFYRCLEAKLQLAGMTQSRLKKSDEIWSQVANDLGFRSGQELLQCYASYAQEVRALFLNVMSGIKL